jgi:(1->4)-alpha-D-glucan 1-alpha-D-glucosylmutase
MRIPAATYRVQLSGALTFAQAAELVSYLRDLGISDLYVSPISAARSGSEHGYDVVDHERLNPELGGEEGFAYLAEALRRNGIGFLLDVVPNHMCVAGDLNRRWLDLLENGPAAPAARFFDVDWRPPKPELVGKVLLPVLPKQYGRALEEDLAVSYAEGRFFLEYDQARLPLDSRTWGHILEPALAALRSRFGDEDPNLLEIESIIRALGHLPLRTDTEPARVRERMHEKEVIRRRLVALVDNNADVRLALDESLQGLNGRRGDPASFDRLEGLLAAQGYRLSLWQVAAHEINYRRFFDINDLAAIRVEDPAVFAAVHALPLRLVRQGVATGFRIDHVDGLSDPQRYLEDLRRAWVQAADPAAGDDGGYVVVEKILMPGERLPSGWPTCGTTGYDFLNLATAVLVQTRAADRLKAIAERFTGEARRYEDVVYESKKLVLRASMAAELTVLARKLDRISEQHRYSRDFTLNSLHDVLLEIVACFPIYRTYVRPAEGPASDRDRAAIDTAVRLAKRRNPVMSGSLFDFVRSILLLEYPPGLSPSQAEKRRDFVRRFQQLTGPVTAKGVEDTAAYRYFPLAALSEVGGHPARIGISVEELHRRNSERLESFPHGLNATSTHDSKRGEDTRARLAVLSEMPDQWEQALDRWRQQNRRLKTDMGGWEAPDLRDEFLLYQTLVGSWPVEALATRHYQERILAYMEKATREAKLHTSWVNPNAEYESAMVRFVRDALDPAQSETFLSDLSRFVSRVARPGYWNSLCQVLVKVAAPGVPDFYQGTELWDLSLVDPDNRRRVDFDLRRKLLADMRAFPEERLPQLIEDLLDRPEDGRIKLLLTWRALIFRRARQLLFDRGGYEPLPASGPLREHLIAFARMHENAAALAVSARHSVPLGGSARAPIREVWTETHLPLPAPLSDRRFRDALAGHTIQPTGTGPVRSLPLSRIFRHLPVALLEAC